MFLDPISFAVMDGIFNRTVRFDKAEERITIRQFVQGVVSRTGEVIYGGTGYSESSVKRGIKKVVDELGIAYCISRPGGNRYGIDWNAVSKFVADNAEKTNLSILPVKIEGHEGPTIGSSRTAGRFSETLHNNREKTLDTKNGYKRSRALIRDQDLSDNHSAEIFAEEVNQEPAPEKTNRRAHNIKGRYHNDLEAEWKRNMRQAWPDTVHLGWTGKEKGQAGNLIKCLGSDNAFEFVEWSVRHWPMTKLSKFPAKRDIICPEIPEFGFLFSFRKDFLDVWNKRKFYASLAGNPKAGLIVALINQGYSEDDAIEEAGQRNRHKERMAELVHKEEEIRQLHRQVGLVYNPKHGIKQLVKEAEARIAASGRVSSQFSTPLPESELSQRLRQIKDWDDE
jgi:hypothetical protein